MLRRTALPLGLVLGMAACDAAPAPPSPIAVRDSGGVKIVENPGNPWEGEERWRLSAEPAVRIGAIDGAADYLFDGITGIAPLGDGRIVVANGGDQSLRWYDPEGRFLTVVAVPPRLSVRAIRGGHLWARATGQLGVQYVVGHTVERE